MRIVHAVVELRSILSSKTSIAFVPTMGNLHAGHIHLVNLAKQHASTVVVSIFVNPLQFGVNEDFGKYPRTLDADCEKLRAAGADIVFAPSVDEVYPDFDGENLNQTMTIALPPIANALCGVSRPGHFSGMATVVLKLFNMVQPQVAVFGKKDFQQLFIVKEMMKQFNLPIEIVAGETVREPSGLAMSSRNGYLSTEENTRAALLQQTLKQIVQQIQQGKTDFTALTASATQTLIGQGWSVDYVEVRSAQTLLPPQPDEKSLVILAAAKLGNTRLIDNIDFFA